MTVFVYVNVTASVDGRAHPPILSIPYLGLVLQNETFAAPC